jgi:CheY-like chemotaxis protein
MDRWSGRGMTRTVSVRVVGFRDSERHSLNTLLRLSDGRDPQYQLWQGGTGPGPDVALIDSDSYEAVLALESPSNAGLKMIWIGPGTPPQAWRCFQRPVQWADVIGAIDELFQPASGLDFDLTMPGGLDDQLPGRRALIASADREHRLYLRARLALSHLTQADDAETAPAALELARRHRYDVALVDLELPGGEGWNVVRQLGACRPRIAHLIATNGRATTGERMRAWLARAHNLHGDRLDPARLQALIERV